MRTLLLLICLSASILSPAQESHFDYDQKLPLDIQEASVEHRGNVAVHDISYASPKGGRVPAYLVVPAGKGRFPAVLWGHWYWASSEFANRKEFLDEAVVLARSGVVSLLVSGPIARPGYVKPKSPFTPEATDSLVQSVVDMRRGADLLLARSDVDPRRLAYVGHSYNASVGGFLSGIDKRFVAFVLMAGNLSDEVDRKTPTFQNIRNKMGAEKFDAIVSRYSWADPGKYVSNAAPATVFLQYASKENFMTPAISRQYFDNVSEPKKYKLYDAPHALNAEARRDRIAFLQKQLKLKNIDWDAVDALPELPQPAN